MAFTVNDLQDLTRLLATHPEWRSEVRRLVLTDELLSLPDIMRSLAQRVDELAEAQRRTEERLEQLTTRVDQLAEAQRRTEERLELLTKTTQQLVNQVAEVRGDWLEIRYRDKAPSYFGRWLRRVRVASISDIEDQIESALTEKEVSELLTLDLLVRGRPRLPVESASASAEEIWLAVEVSSVIDPNDVFRAERRAALLRRAGLKAVPVTAGARIDPEAASLATSRHVAVLQDGVDEGWEQAYQAAMR